MDCVVVVVGSALSNAPKSNKSTAGAATAGGGAGVGACCVYVAFGALLTTVGC